MTSSKAHSRTLSFSVLPGEIFGVAGIVGAGRTELMRAISGADPIAAAASRSTATSSSFQDRAIALDHGVVLVPEDRKAQGLILPQTIAENLALGDYPRGPVWVDPPPRASLLRGESISRFQIKGTGSQLVSELSGGNQQKVVIAKISCASRNCHSDEPTRGIDVGARAAI